ncbi:MAG: N-acetylglucosamine-6-phosphate deacetylase [Thermoanaerobaculales bacterium]|nr:N-acetylglucosamine-6-phosphate deacetylase [Thermoanaerobaculales bacterium]
MNSSLVIRNGRVLGPEGFVESDLAVEGGLISARAHARPAVSIDADGLLVAPGLIDIQINGGFGLDFTAYPATIWEVGARLPTTGVTSFLPTIITSPPERRMKALQVINEGPPPGYHGARALGLHFEGPMLARDRRGTHQKSHLRLPELDLVDGWGRAEGIRLVTLAPELAGAPAVIQALLDRGVVVAAGHSAATYQQAVTALESGLTHGTHLFNGMPPLAPREPGLIGALLEDPDVSVAIIVDGIHLHPATVCLVRACKPTHQVVLITDAMAGMGAGPGVYALADLTVTVDSTSARNPDGGLAGSILTLDQAVRNYVAFTGCSLQEALVAASANPASVIGESTRGRIDAGKVADLIVLDDQLAIQATIVEGALAHHVAGFADRIGDPTPI